MFAINHHDSLPATQPCCLCHIRPLGREVGVVGLVGVVAYSIDW